MQNHFYFNFTLGVPLKYLLYSIIYIIETNRLIIYTKLQTKKSVQQLN